MKKLAGLIFLLTLSTAGAARGAPAERVWVDLTLHQDGGYDEVTQRTRIIRKPTDSDELKRIFAVQGADLAITRVQVIRQRNSGTTTQSVVDADRHLEGNQGAETLNRALSDLLDGDLLDYEVHVRHRRVLPDHHQSLHYFMRRHERFGDGKISIHVPPSNKLKIEARNFDKQTVHHTRQETTYTYQVRNDVELAADAEPVDEITRSPSIVASTFSDYSALARVIDGEFAKAAFGDKSIRQLAAQIAGDQRDPMALAQASYRWVQENIGYDDQNIYANGITPHPADKVLLAKRGDCKDHVVLLMALLHEQGIASEAALVNTANNYRLSPLPVVEDFDHVVVYVPSLHLYADPTDRYAIFGGLPWRLQDKPVLVLGQTGRLARTPILGARASSTQARYVLGAKGSMSMQSTTVSHGDSAVETMMARDAMKDRNMNAMLTTSLQKRGFQSPRGAMSFSSHDDSMLFNMDFTALLPDTPAKSNSLTFNPFVQNHSTLAAVALDFSPQRRHHAFLCGARDIEENYSVDLPVGTVIAALPTSVKYEESELSYRSSYTLHDRTVEIRRRYANTGKRNACDASAYARYHALSQAIAADIKAQILYTLP